MHVTAGNMRFSLRPAPKPQIESGSPEAFLGRRVATPHLHAPNLAVPCGFGLSMVGKHALNPRQMFELRYTHVKKWRPMMSSTLRAANGRVESNIAFLPYLGFI